MVTGRKVFFFCWKNHGRPGFQSRVKLTFPHVFTKVAGVRHRKGSLPNISSLPFPWKIRVPTTVIRLACLRIKEKGKWSSKFPGDVGQKNTTSDRHPRFYTGLAILRVGHGFRLWEHATMLGNHDAARC